MTLAIACGGPQELDVPLETASQALLISNPASIGTVRRSASSNSSATIDISAVSVGNTVIVSVAAGPTAAGGSCSDSRGNTYTLDVQTGGGTSRLLFMCSSRITTALTGSDTITVTYPSFNGWSLASAVRVNGIAHPTRLDQTSGAVGTSNSPSSGNVTTTQANELIFGAVYWDGGAGLTAAPSFTRVATVHNGVNGAGRESLGPMYRIVSSLGSYAAGGTLTQSSAWRTVVGSYIADATAPTVTISSVSPNPTSGGTTVMWSADEPGTYSVRIRATSCSDGTQVRSGSYTSGTVSSVIGQANIADGVNSIYVCVRDGGQNTGFAVSSVTRDNGAPVVTIDAASPNPTSAGTTVTWHASESGTAEVRVSTGATSCTNGTVIVSGLAYVANTSVMTAIPSANLAVGTNNVRVCVTDPASNRGSSVVSIVKNLTAPVVTISSAVPNPTANADVNVTWSGDMTGTYTVRINSTTCSNGTQFQAATSYSPANSSVVTTIPASNFGQGSNSVRICLTSGGVTGGAEVSIVRDSVSPSVSISDVAPDPTNAGATLTFSGSENGTYSVRRGGTLCTNGTQIASGSYVAANGDLDVVLAAADLLDGVNTLRVCLTDAVGNRGSSATTVTKDGSAPTVTVVSVSPNPSAFAGTTVTFSANEGGTYSVRSPSTTCSDGVELENGAYAANSQVAVAIAVAELSEGPNTVRICVTDALGNTGMSTASVTQDTTVPTVNVVSVSPNPVTTGNVTLTFNGSENGTYSVRLNSSSCATGTQIQSGTYTAGGDLGVTLSNASLGEGANPLRVCLTDAAGNVGATTTSVDKDSITPTISALSVTPEPSGAAGTTLSFAASESGAYSIRRGSSSCANGTVLASGSYTAPASQAVPIAAASLAEGPNALRVCVTDGAGNTGNATTTATKDTSAPTVTLACLAPTSGTSTVTFSSTETGNYTLRLRGTTCSNGTLVASGVVSSINTDIVNVIPASSLLAGNNAVFVCVTDSLGNVGSASGTIVFRAPVSVDLASQSANRRFVGGVVGGEFGSMTVGDINNDAFDDLVVAERPGRNALGVTIRRGAGTVYAYAGGAGFFSVASTTVPTGAFAQIVGGDIDDDLAVRNLGRAFSGIDVTGDGIGDLVISAAGADGVANGRLDAGEVYVISGGSGLTGFIDLAGDALPAQVFARIVGPVAGGAAEILDVRDVDGDGRGDLLIGVPLASPGGRQYAGEVYVVRGGASLAGTLDLSSPGGQVIASLQGRAAGDEIGTAGALGELSGDSSVDVLLGAPLALGGSGSAYAVFGPLAGALDLSASSASVEWTSDLGARLGHDVGIGNVRGTAVPDAIISARRMRSTNGVIAGGVALFDGPLTPQTIMVANQAGYGGAEAVVFGDGDDDSFGASVQHGDVDGDGYEDLIVGAYRSDGPSGSRSNAGEGYVVLGGQCMTPVGDLAFDTPSMIVHGPRVNGNLARYHASTGAGDLDGDGQADVCFASQIGGTGETYCFSAPW